MTSFKTLLLLAVVASFAVGALLVRQLLPPTVSVPVVPVSAATEPPVSVLPTVPETAPWLDIAPPRVASLEDVQGRWVRDRDNVVIVSQVDDELELLGGNSPEELNLAKHRLYPWYIRVHQEGLTKFYSCGVFDTVHGDGWRAAYCENMQGGVEPKRIYLNLADGNTRTLWLKVGEDYANILNEGAE